MEEGKNNLDKLFSIRSEYHSGQPLLRKSISFSVRVIQLVLFLKKKGTEFNISHQIVRSGTSIGANASEAYHAYSRLDFQHKLSLSQKEAKETKYWLDVLFGAGFISLKYYESLYDDCDELHRIVSKSIITSKNNGTKPKKNS
ncbi:MAG: four helix bundle protein [Bacteroidetes bacterium]|nr:four helix bundle protein [Bacteroidota bacterium]